MFSRSVVILFIAVHEYIQVQKDPMYTSRMSRVVPPYLRFTSIMENISPLKMVGETFRLVQYTIFNSDPHTNCSDVVGVYSVIGRKVKKGGDSLYNREF